MFNPNSIKIYFKLKIILKYEQLLITVSKPFPYHFCLDTIRKKKMEVLLNSVALIVDGTHVLGKGERALSGTSYNTRA